MKQGWLRFATAVILMVAVMVAQGAPVNIWDVDSDLGGSVYYGGAVKDHEFYTGQINWGPQVWDIHGNMVAGTNIRHIATIGSKCSLPIGDYVFFTHANGDGIYRINSDWETDFVEIPVNPDDTGPEALATDGEYLYTNNDAERGKIHKYEIDNEVGSFTLTEVWNVETGLGRVRSISHHKGYIYAVDSVGSNVVSVAADTGDVTPLFSLPPTDKVYYQAVRSGDRIFVVDSNQQLHVYETDGTEWTSVGSYSITHAGYGISDVDNGNVWITGTRRISFWSLRELPFTDDFESYSVGMPLNDIAYNGWSGTDSATVQAGVGVDSSQAACLAGEATVTNSIYPSASLTKAWTDLQILPVRMDAAPAFDDSVSVMLFVNEDGYLVVYDPDASSWSVCSNNVMGEIVAPADEETYMRVSLFQNYESGKVAVFLNNELVREGIAMGGNRTHYEELSMLNTGESTAFLDNFRVSDSYPEDLDGDVDGNGWIDAYELANFGSLNAKTNGVPCIWLAERGLSDPDGDEDGDDMTNAQEYFAGTDPNDASSKFQILRIEHVDGEVVLTIMGNDSGASTPYVVERSTDLKEGFEEYDTAARGVEPADTVYTDEEPPVTGPIFYRIKAVK